MLYILKPKQDNCHTDSPTVNDRAGVVMLTTFITSSTHKAVTTASWSPVTHIRIIVSGNDLLVIQRQ